MRLLTRQGPGVGEDAIGEGMALRSCRGRILRESVSLRRGGKRTYPPLLRKQWPRMDGKH